MLYSPSFTVFLLAVRSRDIYLNETQHCLIWNCGNQICSVSCLCVFADSSEITSPNCTNSEGTLCTTRRSHLVRCMFCSSWTFHVMIPALPAHIFPVRCLSIVILAAGVWNLAVKLSRQTCPHRSVCDFCSKMTLICTRANRFCSLRPLHAPFCTLCCLIASVVCRMNRERAGDGGGLPSWILCCLWFLLQNSVWRWPEAVLS